MGSAAASNIQIITTIGAVCMALLVIVIRLQAAKKPTSLKKIIMPPIGMTTGFLMFIIPQMRVPVTYALAALIVGFLFSYPLIATSKFQIIDGEIYLKRSKAFVVILLVLLVLRMGLHRYVENFITLPQTGAVFFILAYGMIVPWRIAMVVKYREMTRLASETN